MIFAHDTELNLRAAVALVNSGFAAPREVDTLATTDALDDFFQEFSYGYAPEATPALLGEVTALREPLHELLTARRDDMVALVNSWLAEARALPQLVRHGGLDWHIHAVPVDAHVPVQIKVETAMAMIDVIRADETDRLSRCAADDCDGVVLDLSRNRSKRFCSTQCGNREAVREFRARQRG